MSGMNDREIQRAARKSVLGDGPLPDKSLYLEAANSSSRPSLGDLLSHAHEHDETERAGLPLNSSAADRSSFVNSLPGAVAGREARMSMSKRPANRCKALCIQLCASTKFGWVDGVFVRALLSIWGVIMFLRIGWMVALSGVGQTTIIMLVCVFVTATTTMSISAIATNGELKGGGAYYLLSRSLGPSFGGSIGLIFAFANAVAVSFHLVGFAETVVDLYRGMFAFVDGQLWDVRIVALLALVAMAIISFVGVGWTVKMTFVFLAMMVVPIIAFIAGTAATPPIPSLGFTGFNATTLAGNLNAVYGTYNGVQTDFWYLLAVFFPAVTGIMSGVNISGDLRDPQKAIPKGTLLAVFVSGAVYLVFAWLLAATVERWSLLQNLLIMQSLCLWAPLLPIGIFAAALSSALGNLVGAPRILQAVCKDEIFPVLKVFGRGYRKANEPYPAYGLAILIAGAFILIGELNAIAPLITNFFLVTYALVNFACFVSSVAKSPGWRPSWKSYNPFFALLGAILCIASMFLIGWIMALVTIIVVILLYLYVAYRSPKKNFGSAGQAFTYVQALRSMFNLSQIPQHVKNFRPSFLVLTGNVGRRQDLLHFTRFFKHSRGVVICGNVIVTESDVGIARRHMLAAYARNDSFLYLNSIRAFQDVTVATSLRAGVQQLSHLSGLGRVRPNTLVLGFREKWRQLPDSDVLEYVDVIRDAFDANLGVMLTRNVDRFPPVRSIRMVCGRTLKCCFRAFRFRGKPRVCCGCLMPRLYRNALGPEPPERLTPDMFIAMESKTADNSAEAPVSMMGHAPFISEQPSLDNGDAAAAAAAVAGEHAIAVQSVRTDDDMFVEADAPRLSHSSRPSLSSTGSGAHPPRSPALSFERRASRSSAAAAAAAATGVPEEEPPVLMATPAPGTLRDLFSFTNDVETVVEPSADTPHKSPSVSSIAPAAGVDDAEPITLGAVAVTTNAGDSPHIDDRLPMSPTPSAAMLVPTAAAAATGAAAAATDDSSASRAVHFSALPADSKHAEAATTTALLSPTIPYQTPSPYLYQQHLSASTDALLGAASLQNGTVVHRPRGTVDVYWLADDGGFTLLLPHLLQVHSFWQRTRTRIITVVGGDEDPVAERESMQDLIRRFRIDAEPIVVSTGDVAPDPSNVAEYERRYGIAATGPNKRARRFIRLREIFAEHSSQADLIMCTLFVPARNIDPRTYMSWIDYLTLSTAMSPLPPISLVRGNQESVLTFYS